MERKNFWNVALLNTDGSVREFHVLGETVEEVFVTANKLKNQLFGEKNNFHISSIGHVGQIYLPTNRKDSNS